MKGLEILKLGETWNKIDDQVCSSAQFSLAPSFASHAGGYKVVKLQSCRLDQGQLQEVAVLDLTFCGISKIQLFMVFPIFAVQQYYLNINLVRSCLENISTQKQNMLQKNFYQPIVKGKFARPGLDLQIGLSHFVMELMGRIQRILFVLGLFRQLATAHLFNGCQ